VEFDHVRASGMLGLVETADGGSVLVPALPVRMSGSHVPLRRGPQLGEHTNEVEDRLSARNGISGFRGEGAQQPGGHFAISWSATSRWRSPARGNNRAGAIGRARVIKFERSQDPDAQAVLANLARSEINRAAMNGVKESIAVDLRTPEGMDVVRRLIARADIVVENFGPGTMERLGLDYETVRKINPRVIYASSKGFNPASPWGRFFAYDVMCEAVGGASSVTGHREVLRFGPAHRGAIRELAAISSRASSRAGAARRDRRGTAALRVHAGCGHSLHAAALR